MSFGRPSCPPTIGPSRPGPQSRLETVQTWWGLAPFSLHPEIARWAGMCPRHVVALALVGWYLMVPPSALPPGVAYKEPLSKWQIVRGFDTADDCRDFLGTFSEDSQQKQALNML
jgi:hypothetical protein